MARKFIAVLLGIIVAFSLVALIESIGHRVYPPPPGYDLSDAAQLAEYMQLIPLGALFFVLAAWTVAALGGGLIACRIAGEKPLVYASIIGALVLIAAAATMAVIPHPTWFSISAIVLIAAATLLAGRLSSNQ